MAQPKVYDELSNIKVLCYGNNNIPSSEFSDFYTKRSEKARNFPSRISLYYAPDLDLFNRFEDPVYTPEVRVLIEQRKIDVFLILISLEGIFSQNMFELLTSIPTVLGLSEESFWKKAVIAFDTKERPDPKQYIERSIERNIAIQRMVDKVGGRYTYMSHPKPDALLDNLEISIRKVYSGRERKETVRSSSLFRKICCGFCLLRSNDDPEM